MTDTDQLRRLLTAEHWRALEWFDERGGLEIRWPAPLHGDLHLVNRAKGIHKPAGWQYALSVRETLSGEYDDKKPQFHDDGTWRYEYHQEGDAPAERDDSYTNRGLMTCLRDGVPVGVLRQTQGKPNVRYEVLGLALVKGWNEGWFTLEGLAPGTLARRGLTAGLAEGRDVQAGPESPQSDVDARERIKQDIVRRRGQAKFRNTLIDAYSESCAVTASHCLDVLEAAHIYPYRGDHTNEPSNGLLLRADIHTLFDAGKLTVDPEHYTVRVSSTLAGTEYEVLNGKRLALPDAKKDLPSRAALEWHVENVFRD